MSRARQKNLLFVLLFLFLSLNECKSLKPETTQSKVSICGLELNKGNGNFLTRRWYFDQSAQKCVRFWYKGEGGNRNNFRSEEKCLRACIK
jgi:hypothetical protein